MWSWLFSGRFGLRQIATRPELDENWTSPQLVAGVIVFLMGWDTKDIARLEQLWAAGLSAAQIARQLQCSRDAVCGRLTRLGLKRGHKVPTAKPKIRPTPKPRRALAACGRPVERKVSKPQDRPELKAVSKRQLYAILADAVRNTG